jgi:hypothetical protein
MIPEWAERMPGFVWPLIGCVLGFLVVLLDIWLTVRKDRPIIKRILDNEEKIRKLEESE